MWSITFQKFDRLVDSKVKNVILRVVHQWLMSVEEEEEEEEEGEEEEEEEDIHICGPHCVCKHPDWEAFSHP
jgi:endo-alpha-1,4-polygalactosaminidase (GH114 family)